MADDVKAKASGATKFEAAIRRRARPVLTAEERAAIARDKELETAQLAAARCRDAAAAQLNRAEAWDAKVAELGGGA